MKPRVLLIDLSSLYWSAYHATAQEVATAARTNTLAAVKRCQGDGGDLVAICCDSGRSFRKELSPTYKANREKAQESAYGELEKTKERLRADGYLLWSVDGFEADDLIATACAKAVAEGHEVRIASADKDLLQLLGPGVDCLRTHTWTVAGAKEAEDKFGVAVRQFGDWLALVGDKSDNIAGAPGIGPVTATRLLKKYDRLGVLWAAVEANTPGEFTPAIHKSLSANMDAVDLARKLVELQKDAPITWEEIYAERKPQRLTEEIDMDEPGDATDATEPASEAAPSGDDSAKAADSSTGTPASVALVPVEYERGLEPTSIGGAYKLAKGLFESRLYQRFMNPEAIMAVIIRGREMGLGALTALDSFHVIEGKPCPHAYLIIARAKADADCEYFQCIDTTPEGATWETKSKRNPQPTRLRYTIGQAQAAGLVKQGSNWTKRPDEMLRKTCGAQLARMEYPASAMGLYAIAEMGGDE